MLNAISYELAARPSGAKQAAEKAEIVVSIGIPRGLKSPRNDKNKKLTARLKPE
jgi:hypothetical protein